MSPAIIRPSVCHDSIKVDLVAPALGAELSNICLADAGRDRDQLAEIRSLLLKHKVLFFRDQDITPLEQQVFAEQFGQLDVHPLAPMHPEAPGLLPIHRNTGTSMYGETDKHSYENAWHSDLSYTPSPPMGAVLRCLTCPEIGGDTMWANMVLAYERLPEHVRHEIDGLFAKHAIEHTFGASRPYEERLALGAKRPPVEHPVVRTHPETGEKILYVSAFASHFSNYHNWNRMRYGQDFQIESNRLMDYLVSQAAIPEYQVRLRWKPNTVAFWDNRSTQHYALHDYTEPRSMLRAAIMGDRPV